MEEYFRQGIRKIGLWALVAAAVLVVIGIRSMRPDDAADILNVFDHVYCTGQPLAEQPLEESLVVRLEEDKTMLVRRSQGVWENLGILVRGETEQNAMEAWKTADGSFRILVMTQGVCLADRQGTVWLERVDTLSVGVNGQDESFFLSPQWYPQEEAVSKDHLSRCTVSGKVTVVLNLEEYQDELTVEVDGEAVTLPRDRSRAFLLDVEGQSGEEKLFEVPFGEGAYRFAVKFE